MRKSIYCDQTHMFLEKEMIYMDSLPKLTSFGPFKKCLWRFSSVSLALQTIILETSFSISLANPGNHTSSLAKIFIATIPGCDSCNFNKNLYLKKQGAKILCCYTKHNRYTMSFEGSEI